MSAMNVQGGELLPLSIEDMLQVIDHGQQLADQQERHKQMALPAQECFKLLN